jgi:antitoxin (DNA-binding transcriptional repressor) of toxin-antitoxin stability system
MTTVSIPEAQRDLPKLLKNLNGGGAFLIADSGNIVARVDSVATPAKRPSLRDIKPSSVGALLKPLNSADDDILGEMLDSQK